MWIKILEAAGSHGIVKHWHVNRTIAPDKWHIAFDSHSKKIVPMLMANPGNVRAVFCIRDPRDIVVSRAYYHMTSTESWLHAPREEFDGLTYQQKICSLPDMQSRFQFEMRFAARRTIRKILKIPRSSPDVVVTKLETLIMDFELEEFSRLFDFLAFDDEQRAVLLEAAADVSIFSRKLNPPAHVRSGKPAQYLSEFSTETLAMFNAINPGVPEALGYPP